MALDALVPTPRVTLSMGSLSPEECRSAYYVLTANAGLTATIELIWYLLDQPADDASEVRWHHSSWPIRRVGSTRMSLTMKGDDAA